MAKVKEMSFSRSLSLSKKFNNAKCDFGLVLTIEDGEDLAAAKEKAWATIDAEMTKQLKETIDLLAVLPHD